MELWGLQKGLCYADGWVWITTIQYMCFLSNEKQVEMDDDDHYFFIAFIDIGVFYQCR